MMEILGHLASEPVDYSSIVQVRKRKYKPAWPHHSHPWGSPRLSQHTHMCTYTHLPTQETTEIRTKLGISTNPPNPLYESSRTRVLPSSSTEEPKQMGMIREAHQHQGSSRDKPCSGARSSPHGSSSRVDGWAYPGTTGPSSTTSQYR